MRWGSGASAAELRVRLAAEPASVPGARRFVADGLAGWGHTGIVDDAALCVSEMAANAALHSGSRFMEVVVCDLSTSVRVAVEDAGQAVPAQAVRPRMVAADGVTSVEDQPTTGRGLAIVSMIAQSWGVEETAHGRRVWADLTGAGAAPRPADDIRATAGVVADGPGQPAADGPLPADWKTTRMLRCPVRLALRIDQHLDDLVRELQLIDADRSAGAVPPPREVAELIRRLVSGPAWARHTGRRMALDAAAAGLELADIEMTMPRATSTAVRELLDVARTADRVCEQYGLLTLAATPEMDALRSWFTECMVAQLEGDADPVPYADWLAARR